MGKRNKFGKIGIMKKNSNALLRAKNKKNTTINVTRFEDEDMEMESDLNNTTSNLNNTKSKIKLKDNNSSSLNKSIINEEKVNRQSALLGIDKKTLMSVMENPLRHRRQVTKVVLSKGQRKRLEKRQKFVRRDELVEKIKLNNSTINSSQLNKTNITISNIRAKEKKDQFNLFDINNTLTNVLDDIQQGKNEEVKTSNIKFSNTHRNKRNLKKILNEEKDKIMKVMENKSYQSNPLEAMKFHIKNTQLINERNKKIEENFQKNYNLLNLKK